ncbi:MAG: DegT/DnrJ/EryC1/StrS family aminotransferase [Candidatus Omnitrophica bacterium]|nr:DegT/DnrJ/EryC1/StrS family aminotransferase [Candidatus Omnitrophota bacterium]
MGTCVPYIDYSLIPGGIKKEILLEVSRVISLRNSGEHEQYVASVTQLLAQYFQTKFGVAVDSGTTALQLSLSALGVKAGDEVIIPTYTYVATALAVTNLGAKPVFADIKFNDLTIDPDCIESLITSRTKVVIPVHIHGLCCDIKKIQKICMKHKIALVEDASQAHGALIHGKKAGSFGIGCFSLHTSKNLGGIGDAGFIALNDKDLCRKIEQFLTPESPTQTALEGRRTPCTMDAIQAAIIQKKLAILDMVNDQKREIASRYDTFIVSGTIKKAVPMKDSRPVYRDYFILAKNRDALRDRLLKQGIETKPGYVPLHLSKPFDRFYGHRQKLPVSETIAGQVLLLPSFFGLSDGQLKRVCAVLRGIKNA